MDDLPEKAKEFLPDTHRDKLKEFFSLMFDDDCRKAADCEELLSPCCSGELSIIFGSFPVEVECQICKNKLVLRDLVTS